MSGKLNTYTSNLRDHLSYLRAGELKGDKVLGGSRVGREGKMRETSSSSSSAADAAELTFTTELAASTVKSGALKIYVDAEVV